MQAQSRVGLSGGHRRHRASSNAKISDALPVALISLDANVLSAPSADSVSVIDAHRTLVPYDAIPIAALHLISTGVLLDIAGDTHRALAAIGASVAASGGEAVMAEVTSLLWEHRPFPPMPKSDSVASRIEGSVGAWPRPLWAMALRGVDG